MDMFQSIGSASDRVMAALISGLEVEFGTGIGGSLTAHFLAAEEADYTWDARIMERWIGAYDGADGLEIELDRIAILGRLDGDFYCAICLVDGDGMVHGLTQKRMFECETAAHDAYVAMKVGLP
ncbi:hypothetical protein [Sphingobium boeckii]|uniref:Uncharacterized protein n=1 Tax=Sphingobium boeckii TaxID=1082345 RepID=A0A7W9EEL8_9SPHN|nr:hypothetical protein [Sphingobium boeckii]MBB5686312.1 hypothetical protein [Sphingobium boeckii]